MTDVRLKPEFTLCRRDWGGRVHRFDGNLTRHSVMIRDLGTCRLCGSQRLYKGSREEMLEELAYAFLKIYVDRDEAKGAEAVWGVEDTFFAAVMNLAEEELPEHVEDDDLEVDYDIEGLRIVREGLMRAAGKIEAHLNASGEDL